MRARSRHIYQSELSVISLTSQHCNSAMPAGGAPQSIRGLKRRSCGCKRSTSNRNLLTSHPCAYYLAFKSTQTSMHALCTTERKNTGYLTKHYLPVQYGAHGIQRLSESHRCWPRRTRPVQKDCLPGGRTPCCAGPQAACRN